MSSFGNRGRQPDKPGDKGKQPVRGSAWQNANANQQPQITNDDDVEEGQQTRLSKWSQNVSGSNVSRQEQPSGEPVEKIEIGRRCVALIFDCIACYVIGLILQVVPFLVHFVTLSMTWALLLLVRDWFFEGRGIGKNLMGLQVIDIRTGAPCSLRQSIMRNIVILGPFAVLQVISIILPFVPIAWLTEGIKGMINAVGMVYLAIMMPVECYRAYSRDDGLRFGDQFAGTAIVDAAMDFSNPFSKRQ
jgi:hypothetical protein